MKTEKDKLIDEGFEDYLKEKRPYTYSKLKLEMQLYLESINPRNEVDWHRKLEDNKDEEKPCSCCGTTNFRDKNIICNNCLDKWMH